MVTYKSITAKYFTNSQKSPDSYYQGFFFITAAKQHIEVLWTCFAISTEQDLKPALVYKVFSNNL
ncbi:hypothetical protein CXF71_00990 [Colwellia sp. 12G3]|nr:hypothetical protein CXF71_00990 [Colwellia sp. 12G3]